MSILTLVALLFGAMISSSIIGGLLELVTALLYGLIPAGKKANLEIQSTLLEHHGIKQSRFAVAQFAPGIGHIIVISYIVKDFAMFGFLGFANGFIVSKFLENPDRMDWLWYLIGFINMTPAMPNAKAATIPIGFRGVVIIVYVVTCFMLSNK